MKKLARKKWEKARDAKGYDYERVDITAELKKQVAPDYLELIAPSLID